MPRITSNSRNSFSSMLSSVNALNKEVNAKFYVAVRRDDTTAIIKLASASADLQDEVLRLRELQMDYEACQTGVTDAEKNLAQGANDARQHVRSMETVENALKAVAELTGTFSRLLALFA